MILLGPILVILNIFYRRCQHETYLDSSFKDAITIEYYITDLFWRSIKLLVLI